MVSLTTLLVIPAVLWLLYVVYDKVTSKGRAPRFNYLLSAFSGKFNFKTTGPVGLIDAGFKECGEIFRIRVAHKSLTFLIGPEAQAVLFNAKDNVAEQREVYKFTVPVFGRNILYDASMKRMAQQLKFVKNGLSGPAMESHGRKIVDEAVQYFASWAKEGEVSLNEVFNELTILTASRCLLGQDVRDRMHKEVAKHYFDLEHGMTPLTFFWPNAPTTAHRKRNKAREAMVKIFGEAIEKRRKEPPQEDFMQVLMDSTYSDGSRCTTDEVAGLLIAALFGGQHTSAITSSWVGLLLHTHQEYLPRLLEEQKIVLTESKGQLTLDAVTKMRFLQNCILETLRLYPPLLLLMRYVCESNGIQYKDYHIPKGEIIIAAPPVAHRIPSVYPEPDRFNPDRWTEDIDKGSMNFIAFGAGRHACLGQRFGILQVTAIWSVLLRNFEFELIDKLPPVDYSALVAGPSGRCRVRYRRRPVPIA